MTYNRSMQRCFPSISRPVLFSYMNAIAIFSIRSIVGNNSANNPQVHIHDGEEAEVINSAQAAKASPC